MAGLFAPFFSFFLFFVFFFFFFFFLCDALSTKPLLQTCRLCLLCCSISRLGNFLNWCRHSKRLSPCPCSGCARSLLVQFSVPPSFSRSFAPTVPVSVSERKFQSRTFQVNHLLRQACPNFTHRRICLDAAWCF